MSAFEFGFGAAFFRVGEFCPILCLVGEYGYFWEKGSGGGLFGAAFHEFAEFEACTGGESHHF